MGRRIARTAGLVVLVVCAVTIPVPLLTRAWPAAGVLAIVGAAGFGLARLVGPAPEEDVGGKIGRLAQAAVAWSVGAVVMGGVTWLLATALGGDATAVLRDPTSAFFEGTSGLTTTGLTMVDDPSLLPPTLQWWRTVLQATGAVGVVVFGLLIGEPSGDRDVQIGVEWSATPPGEGREVGQRIVAVLGGVVLFGFVGLLVGGEPAWRALNHAITAAATGGFAITSQSAADSSSVGRVVLALTAVLGAISFGTLYATVTRTGPALWRRTQVRTAAVMLLVTAGPAVLFAAGDGLSVGDTLFNAVSATTTTGFSVGDGFARLPVLAFLATIAMLTGGSAGSTAGGIKTARIAWIVKSIARFLPSEAVPDEGEYEWDGEDRDNDEALRRIVGAGVIISVWIASLFVGVVLLRATVDEGMTDLLLETASAMSGTGLSSGVTSAELETAPKVVLSLLMLTGRLEITAFIALVAYSLGQRSEEQSPPGEEEGAGT